MRRRSSGSTDQTPHLDVDKTILATGLSFPEGPCVDENGDLFFVELCGRRISTIRDGRCSPWASLPGSPNGAAFGPDRRLYVCDGGGRWPPFPSTNDRPGPGDQPGLIWRVSMDGRPEVLIREIDGVALNGPNDLCFDDVGGFYFTDPEWEPPGEAGAIRRGEVCYVRADGAAVRAHSGLRFPNGLHVTPDGAALLVGETDTGLVHRFPILRPGQLGQPDVYVDLGPGSGPDGMCFDSRGRLLVTASTGGCIFVVVANGGLIEAVIESDDPCPTNACFGGPEMRTLYVTEGGYGRVVALDWDAPGLTLFPDRRPLSSDEGSQA